MGLRGKQLECFEAIATGQYTAPRFHPATVAALLRKKMVDRSLDHVLRHAGLLAVSVPAYEVPTALHIRWAEWCSAELEGVELDGEAVVAGMGRVL